MDLAQVLASLTDKLGRVGLSGTIAPFNGIPSQLNSWIKSIDKSAVINDFSDANKVQIAFQYSTGKVSDFIQRFLDQNNNATWAELRRELESRFGEIKNQQSKFAELTRIRQNPGENVQLFAERLLTLAEEAYGNVQNGLNVVEEQLIMFFTEGLIDSSVRAKLIRQNPDRFVEALNIATTEQNICERIKMRSTFEYSQPREHVKPREQCSRYREEPSRITFTGYRSRDSDGFEPMDINYARRRVNRCSFCHKTGHSIADCRTRQAKQINEVRHAVRSVDRRERLDSRREPRCWFCGRPGHMQNECRELKYLKGTRRRSENASEN